MDSATPNSRRARLWLIVVVLLVLSLADLLLRGWDGDARVLLLACVFTVTLYKGWRSGVLALAVSIIGLSVVGFLENASGFSLTGASPFPLGMLLFGLGAFLISGVLVVFVARTLSSEADDDLVQARQDTRSLARTVWDARIAALQTSNQGLQRQNRYLDASLSVAQLLSTVFDVRTLVNNAAELISEQFSFTDVMIYLTDGAEEWATLRAASTVAGKELVLRDVRLRRGSGGPIGWVMTQKQPQVLSQDERAKTESGYIADPDPAGSRSSVTLPLLLGQQLIGILDIRSVRDQASMGEELGSLEGLATHLALAINNARRLSDETVILEATSPVYRTASDLATARTEKEVYDVFMSALRLYGPSRISIVRATGATGDLSVVVDMQDTGTDYVTQDLARSDLARLTPSNVVDVVILGLALDDPLWVWDLSDLDESLNPELSSALADLTEGSSAHAMALIPIQMAGTAAEGCILLLYRTTHRFTPVERRLHQLLAELGGAALDRSRLLTEARARLDREEVLLSVGEKLRSSLDPDVIMRRAVEELCRALDAELATIEIAPDRAYVTDGLETHPLSETASRVEVSDLVLPLDGAEGRFGMVKVQRRPRRELTSEQTALAQAITGEAGLALERARFFVETQEALVEIEALVRGSRAIIDAESPQAILGAIAGNAAMPELDRLLLIVSETPSEGGHPRMRLAAVQDHEYPVPELSGRVWSDVTLPVLGHQTLGRHLVIENVAIDEALDEVSRRVLLGEVGIASALVIPLNAGQHGVGWLVVGATGRPHAFSTREQRLYGGLAAVVAAVVRSFQLLDLAVSRAERSQSLSLILSRMRETLDMDLILQTALREIGESLGASSIEVRMGRESQ